MSSTQITNELIDGLSVASDWGVNIAAGFMSIFLVACLLAALLAWLRSS